MSVILPFVVTERTDAVLQEALLKKKEVLFQLTQSELIRLTPWIRAHFTSNEQLKACEAFGIVIRHQPPPYISDPWAAFVQNPSAIQGVTEPVALAHMQEWVQKVEENPFYLNWSSYQTTELWEMVWDYFVRHGSSESKPYMLGFVPARFRSRRMGVEAIRIHPNNIKYVSVLSTPILLAFNSQRDAFPEANVWIPTEGQGVPPNDRGNAIGFGRV